MEKPSYCIFREQLTYFLASLDVIRDGTGTEQERSSEYAVPLYAGRVPCTSLSTRLSKPS